MTVDAATLTAALAALPRAQLAALPTPFHALPGLGRSLGGYDTWTKRDDMTGLAFGGNKVRELDFIIGQARADGADTLIAGGGVAQSNHARQCAAAARAVGMDVELVLRRGLRANDQQGNRLITDILGAHVHWVDDDPQVENRTSTEPVMRQVEAAARSRGRRPCTLVSSFHPLAAVSYVACALELAAQTSNAGFAGRPVHLWVTSMGATHVGLALGIRWLGLPWTLTAVSWKPVPAGLSAALTGLADETAGCLGLTSPLGPDEFVTLNHGGPAYGIPSDDTWDAVGRCARSDGFLLDPVYTGKGMAGLIAAIGRRDVPQDDPIVFIHTGGLPALFAYSEEAVAALELTR